MEQQLRSVYHYLEDWKAAWFDDNRHDKPEPRLISWVHPDEGYYKIYVDSSSLVWGIRDQLGPQQPWCLAYWFAGYGTNMMAELIGMKHGVCLACDMKLRNVIESLTVMKLSTSSQVLLPSIARSGADHGH